MKMKYVILMFILLWMAAATQPMQSLYAQSAQAQSLLWKVEGSDLPTPSYLFGTIHAICPDEVVITDAIEQAVDTSAQVALELDLDDQRLMVEMGRLAFLPGDSTLHDIFSEEDYARLNQWMKDSVGVSIDPMVNLRPLWLIGMLINQVIGCKSTSYEEIFMAKARRQGKDIIGIEQPEEQLAAFSTIPLEEQARMVLDIIDDMDSTRAEFRRLADAYTAHDLQKLRDLVLNSSIEYGRYSEELIEKRNRRWIQRILREARREATFFAVGAGHLPGDEGLISLLREEGYTVTPVPPHAE